MSVSRAYITRRAASADTGLRHLVRSLPLIGTGRSTVDAACGAQVARDVGEWDPQHGRACRACARRSVW